MSHIESDRDEETLTLFTVDWWKCGMISLEAMDTNGDGSLSLEDAPIAMKIR